jgi:hypothetical protein
MSAISRDTVTPVFCGPCGTITSSVEAVLGATGSVENPPARDSMVASPVIAVEVLHNTSSATPV